MQLREFIPSDCTQLAELFYQTVHSVNAKDCTQEQLNAWATSEVDLQAWDSSFRAHRTIVATENSEIVGFGDMDETGYLDRLYGHKDYQGKVLHLRSATNWSASRLESHSRRTLPSQQSRFSSIADTASCANKKLSVTALRSQTL